MQASFSVHAGGCNAHSTNGDYFFETWDTQMLNASYKLTQCCDKNSSKCLDNLVSHTLNARDRLVASLALAWRWLSEMSRSSEMSERWACNRRTTAAPSLRW